MTLGQYLSMACITQAEFAAKSGLDQSTVSKLVMGKFSPSLPVLSRIREASIGAVTPNDFLPPIAQDGAADE